MKKILIIRLGAIGDVVHTTNLYRAIKQKYPEVQVHYLTSSLIKPLLSDDIDIEKIITTPEKFKLFSQQTIELIKILKNENYNVVFNLQPSLKTRIITYLAGIKKQFLYKKDFKMHAVKNFWALGLKEFPNIKELKYIKLYLSEEKKQKAKDELKDLKRPVIIVNAGGMLAKRQGRAYPIDKWIDLCTKIENYYNASILITGTKEDSNFLLPLKKIKNSVDFIGKLTLIDLCALISQSDLMISGDSGPLHIATALNVKSIGLYGSMPISRTGCYCNGINIVSKKECVPCNRRKCKFLKNTNKIYAPCMEEICVNEIFNQIKTIYGH